MNSPDPAPTDTIDAAATQWLSRRDRGLTAAEQDAYLQWLADDPRHGAAIARYERAWRSLDQLTEWRPAHSAIPNPDLLAPRPAGRIYRVASLLVAAAAVALAAFVWLPWQSSAPAPRREAIVHPGPERQNLPDGSVVELNQGARIDVQFTPGERHVRLLAGEAHFIVAHNAARPFFVDTGNVSVRAVGTAFTVARALSEISVLVTEGKVQVIKASVGDGGASASPSPTFLIANQRAVVALTAENAPPTVQDLTPAEMERAMSWQALRLEFVDMPLRDVVAEFNRYNRQRLAVADDETGRILVGGSFRLDNVDTFVRLLELSFGVTAAPRGDEIVLRRVP